MRRLLPYIWTWPLDVPLWILWILPFRAAWGRDLRWEEGSLAFTLKEDSWPMRTWYKDWSGTSIGHALMYAPHVKPAADGTLHRITVHEQFHVKQFESITLGSFLWAWVPFGVLAAYGHWTAAFVCGSILWLGATLQHAVGNWLCAWIRGERAYRDSYHEQAAYAVDYKYQQTGKRIT